MSNLDRDTVFPSARAMLEAGISVREVGGKGWAVYLDYNGGELTLFPGDEGPQEMSSIDEAIECLGGDQPCVLTPASLRRLKVEASKRQDPPRAEPVSRDSYRPLDMPLVNGCAVYGCGRTATWVREYRNSIMPASAFYALCEGHAKQEMPTYG